MSDTSVGLAPGEAPFTRARTRPEILAPAGDWDCIRAAVENGADAVYFGLQKFNARVRATNFTIDELPDLLSFLRLRGVKANIAFNTLVFADELEEAAKALERILEAGPDAIIIQDFGIARLIRAMGSDVALHASTQTTTTCAEEMSALAELGFSRVILARELSVSEIKRVAAATAMELEVFVHGALCVAYSGQCLTSEALGGRSANRGACAQACRLPYDMIVDGKEKELGEKKYLLSPQDLAAFDLVPELVEAGVSCFKIEGRLKTPEYVAVTTRTYRKAVDETCQGRPIKWLRQEGLDLQQVFSRGLSAGFLKGIDHQQLVPALSPKKRGPFLGTVQSITRQRVRLRLENPLSTGDGICFDYGSPDDEAGGSVYEIWSRGQRVGASEGGDEVELTFGKIDWAKVHVGDRVWKTSDPAMERRIRSTFERNRRRVPVDMVVRGTEGSPLVLEVTDGVRVCQVESVIALQPARKRPLTVEYLREHLARLGATPFELRELRMLLEGEIILPVSHLNELRRQAVGELERLRVQTPQAAIRREALSEIRIPGTSQIEVAPELVVLCRSLEQLRGVLDEGCRWVELDFEDIRKYKEAASLAHEEGAWVALAPPRIHKPAEGGILKFVASCGADAILVRNLAHLDLFRGRAALVGDFSLNIANDLSADWYLRRGLERMTPSYDLNVEQLEALLNRVPVQKVEVVIHQQMPMFHMEHCLFAACLSNGHDASDCGRPCDRHEVRLRDRVGKEHPVKADVGCRNTVFNAVPQSASPYVHRLRKKGVRWFRVELMTQDQAQSRHLVGAYRDLLDGKRDGDSLWQELKASNVFGVTRGPLARME